MAGFFLLLISLVLIVKGVAMILAPKKVLKVATNFLNKAEPRRLGLVPLFIGILLLLCASSSALGWLIVLLGLLEIAKAVYIFSTPLAKIKAHPWMNLSDNNYRAMGILILVLGVLVFISRM
jgi:uncharacterized protein YjeT (DUF2065 family)